MPYNHTGQELPCDNQVREVINSGLILSTIKWPDCIISELFHYGGPGSHGPEDCSDESLHHSRDLFSAYKTAVAEHSIKVYMTETAMQPAEIYSYHGLLM